MLSYLPNPTRDVSDGSNNFDSIAEIEDRAIMYTGKVDHRFSDKVSLQRLLPLQQDQRAVRQLLVSPG